MKMFFPNLETTPEVRIVRTLFGWLVFSVVLFGGILVYTLLWNF